MSTAGNDRDDLSIRLEWPMDPLATPPVTFEREEAAAARFPPHIEAVDSAESPDGEAGAGESVHTNDALLRAFDERIAALDERLAGLRTAMMAMLASRQAEEQATQRRERETLLTRVEEALAASRTQGDVFADRVASELQSLRRRIPVRGRNSSAIDDEAMDELVTRVADEVEIRIAAALKPKPRRKG